jgi:GntR family transcriptional regulator
MYGLFEAEFGVRMIRAEEKIRAVAADAEDAAPAGRGRRRAAAVRSSGCRSPMATSRWNCAAACTTPSAFYRNELNDCPVNGEGARGCRQTSST